jgi:hypothetical protein
VSVGLKFVGKGLVGCMFHTKGVFIAKKVRDNLIRF